MADPRSIVALTAASLAGAGLLTGCEVLLGFNLALIDGGVESAIADGGTVSLDAGTDMLDAPEPDVGVMGMTSRQAAIDAHADGT